jgi:peptide/nickel transport system permease protein
LSAQAIHEGGHGQAHILAWFDGAGRGFGPAFEQARKVVEGVTSYLARRLAMAVFTIYVVISLSFFIVRLMPGNAIEYLEAQMTTQGGLSPEEIQEKVRAIYGVLPSGPLWKQYVQYVGNAFHGNLGNSIVNPGQSVVSIVAGALPWTVFCISVALIISFAVGLIMGTLMATFPKTWFAKLMTAVASFLSAIPNYLVAIVLLYFFADQHAWFPLDGTYSVGLTPGLNWPFIQSALDHAVLPIATYFIVSFGGWALLMKGSVVTTLGADYVRAAESWGLSSRRVTQSYIGRNSLLPMVTNLALSVGFLFGGAVFVETYFTYPGIGYYLINAVNSRDYSLMMGCFIVITVSVVFANLLVDLMYPLVDPRIVSPAQSKRARFGTSGVATGPPGPVGSSLGEQTMTGGATRLPVTDLSA